MHKNSQTAKDLRNLIVGFLLVGMIVSLAIAMG